MPDKTIQTIQALESIQIGTYVYNYNTAQILRNVERIKPGAIILLGPTDVEFLTGRVMSGTANQKLPFFWAELTLEGKEYLSELKKESCPK